LDFFQSNNVFDFIAEIGLVFLMFMAGLEARTTHILSDAKKSILIFSVLASIVPFLVGLGIGIYFGYDLMPALFIGVIFISSSVAVVVPALHANNLFVTRVGKTIMGTAVITDILSLILLSVFLQKIEPTTSMPLPMFYGFLFISLVLLRYLIPKLHNFIQYLSSKTDAFEREVRLVFAIMIGTVVLFEILGLHAVIAGFFAGFVLSSSIKSDVLKEKIHALAYGVFIPVFFVIVGVNMDIGLLLENNGALMFTIAIVLGSVLAKFASGYLAGMASGFTKISSAFSGVAITPSLSTTLAAVFTGFSVGIINSDILTAMIVLSIVTTLIAPVAMSILTRKL